jgi:hypothetical protein
MANELIGRGHHNGSAAAAANNEDVFYAIKFALRLGIANNLAHISFHYTDGLPSNNRSSNSSSNNVDPLHFQQIAQLVEEGAAATAATTQEAAAASYLPFSVLSGILMNIASRKVDFSQGHAAAA